MGALHSFARTPAGLSNLARFHSVEYTVFIEGRNLPEGHRLMNFLTYDELYYRGLLKLFSLKSCKIKVVGSKNHVSYYANEITSGRIANAIAILDRDYEGILSSWVNDRRLLCTRGYSWENDFWTDRLVIAVLRSLMPNVANFNEKEVIAMLDRASRRVARLSKIDFLTKLYDVKFIPNKDRNIGLELNPEKYSVVVLSDLKPLFEKVRKSGRLNLMLRCALVKYFSGCLNSFPRRNVVRGHLWEAVCIRVISHFYKKYTGERTITNTVIKNTAFSVWSGGVADVLGDTANFYYARRVRSAITL